ncbi:CNH domain-containing protein, partial [Meloidogyne graminicola]
LKDRETPITQICCASALGLLLIVVGERVISLVIDDKFKVEEFLNPKRITLNSHPINDDPFSVQIALTDNQKQIIQIGKISSESNYLFIKEKRLKNCGNVVEIIFNGNCICYATNTSYFVQNINEKDAIKLFDVIDSEIPKVICSVGIEEFCIAGIQGLLMFVNGEGASTRAPISLTDKEPPIGLFFKEPFLNVLNICGILFIFSIQDSLLKQSLEFPNENEQKQFNNNYQLSNIDGQIFIIPPYDRCFYELIPLTIYSQIEEYILSENLDLACSLLEEQIFVEKNEKELIQLIELEQKIALIYLQKEEFNKSINLLIKSKLKPNLLLSLVEKQNKNLFDDLNFERIELNNLNNIKYIPIELVKEYLIKIRENNNNCELIENSLARIFIFLNEYNILNKELFKTKNIWNNQQFRLFLVNNYKKLLNFAAKLAIEDNCIIEAFSYWKIILIEENELIEEEKENNNNNKEIIINECFNYLEKINDLNILKTIFIWLIKINAPLCMDKIKYLENFKQIKFCNEFIIELFKNEDFELIFEFLDKRGENNELGSNNLVNNKYIQLLIKKYKEKQNLELRNKLWNFLLFSSYYDRSIALNLLEKEREDLLNDEFIVEKIFIKANENNCINCLQELINIFEINEDFGLILVDAAEILCTRFPSPEILKNMLTIHLRLSKTNSTLQTKIPKLLSLLESETNSGVQILNSLPNNLSPNELIQNFLHRHISNRLNISNWQNVYFKLVNLEMENLEKKLKEKLGRNGFKLDELTCCILCNKTLLNIGEEEEDFVNIPLFNEKFAHLKCYRMKKEKEILD